MPVLLIPNMTLDSPPTVMLSGITSILLVESRAYCFTGISTTMLSSAFLNSGLSYFSFTVMP